MVRSVKRLLLAILAVAGLAACGEDSEKPHPPWRPRRAHALPSRARRAAVRW